MTDPIAADPGISADLLARLRCPDCRSGALRPAGAGVACDDCGATFPVTRGRPILFRHDNDMFRAADYRQAEPAAGGARTGLARFVPEPSVNLSAARVVAHLNQLLPDDATVLVVGAGGQRHWVDPALGGGARHILYCDVDVRASVDLFCDGHDLPFRDASVDAVVTTAVLEHVIDPVRVADEITRVVRPGGYLYSELPFMQQVHEGAYDFTRYTLSGHRRLFRWFAEVEAGMVAGPGTALAWSLENFLLAFARRPRSRALTKAAARLAFGWIARLDRFLEHRAEAMDGASCTFLLGRRADVPVSDVAIVATYVGAKHLSHT